MSSPAEEMRRDVSSSEEQWSYRLTGGDQETSTTQVDPEGTGRGY